MPDFLALEEQVIINIGRTSERRYEFGVLQEGSADRRCHFAVQRLLKPGVRNLEAMARIFVELDGHAIF